MLQVNPDVWLRAQNAFAVAMEKLRVVEDILKEQDDNAKALVISQVTGSSVIFLGADLTAKEKKTKRRKPYLI